MPAPNHTRSRSFLSALYFLACTALFLSSSALWGGTRADFLKLIDRPRVPLAPEIVKMADVGGAAQFRLTFASDASERVPGLLLSPHAGRGPMRRPAVICLHGTGGSKEWCLPLLEELAAHGVLGVAIDGPFHGERARRESYDDAILRAYRTGQGHPLLYDTVWDVMRLIDYLCTRPDVDPDRIGLIGFSKGGMEGYLAAAVDPRIRVLVSVSGVQSFHWALEHGGWSARTDSFKPAILGAARDAGVWFVTASFVRRFYDRVAPGIYSEFDGPSMLRLIAPRPLLAINGALDSKTPRAGVQECMDAARKAYAAAGASDKVRFIIEAHTGHEVTPDAWRTALAWLERWLNPRQYDHP